MKGVHSEGPAWTSPPTTWAWTASDPCLVQVLFQAQGKRRNWINQNKFSVAIPDPLQLPHMFTRREQHFPILLLPKTKRSPSVKTTSMPAPWLLSVLDLLIFKLKYSLKINLLSVSSSKVFFRLQPHIWYTYRWHFLVFPAECRLERWDRAQDPPLVAFLLWPLIEAGPLYFENICLPEG